MACRLRIGVSDEPDNAILRIEGKPAAKMMLDIDKIVAKNLICLLDNVLFFSIHKTNLAIPASSTDSLAALVSVHRTPPYLFCLLAVLLRSTALKMEPISFSLALLSNQLYSITSHTFVVLNKLFN